MVESVWVFLFYFLLFPETGGQGCFLKMSDGEGKDAQRDSLEWMKREDGRKLYTNILPLLRSMISVF